MNQKGFINIVLVVAVVVLIGVVSYFVLVRKSEPVVEQTPSAQTPTHSLSVILGDAPKSITLQPGSGNIIFAKIKLRANEFEGIGMLSITITNSGSASDSDIGNIQLFDGEIQIANLIANSNFVNGKATIGFSEKESKEFIEQIKNKKGLDDKLGIIVVPKNSTKTISIVGGVSPTASSGKIITLGINKASDISGVGIASKSFASIRGNFPVNGNVITITTAESTSVTVLSPNGGEAWPIGSTQIIRWNRSGIFPATTRQIITLLIRGDVFFYEIYKSPVDSKETSFAWVIPNTIPPGSDYKIGVTEYNEYIGTRMASDASDKNFSIIK